MGQPANSLGGAAAASAGTSTGSSGFTWSGAGASGLSLASLGLSAASSIVGAEGTATADQFKAEVLDEQAQYGELQASQTAGQMTRNLALTLGHIDSVQAATRADPTSPTNAAVRDYAEQVGTEQKTIKVDSITQQAQMDEANAAYLREAGNTALLGGEIGAAGSVVNGLAGLLKPV